MITDAAVQHLPLHNDSRIPDALQPMHAHVDIVQALLERKGSH